MEDRVTDQDMGPARMTETDLMWLFMREAPFHLRDVFIERRTILRGARIGVSGARVSSGIPGQCDLFALAPGGVHIEIECKSARGSEREAQTRWRELCQRRGIPHMVFRALKNEAPEATVMRWIEELRAKLPSAP